MPPKDALARRATARVALRARLGFRRRRTGFFRVVRRFLGIAAAPFVATRLRVVRFLATAFRVGDARRVTFRRFSGLFRVVRFFAVVFRRVVFFLVFRRFLGFSTSISRMLSLYSSPSHGEMATGDQYLLRLVRLVCPNNRWCFKLVMPLGRFSLYRLVIGHV